MPPQDNVDQVARVQIEEHGKSIAKLFEAIEDIRKAVATRLPPGVAWAFGAGGMVIGMLATLLGVAAKLWGHRL